MKVLTSAEMREVDRRTIEQGISGEILMENAAHRVVELLVARFSPLSEQRIVILCGKGNNGGDGLAIARILRSRFSPAVLDVVKTEGGQITPAMQNATLVIDALLGTGLAGPARGTALHFIRAINTGFPLAKVVAVDIPSGMSSDSGMSEGEIARADYTVTFTAPKVGHVLPPNCDRLGEFTVGQIGSPPKLYANAKLHLAEPADFRHLLKPRERDSNKGKYGHVLVVGGAQGKSGAAEMAGLAALRMGAGLVTVASSAERLYTLELMTDSLPQSYDALLRTAKRATLLAVGPGLGTEPHFVEMARRTIADADYPAVYDADGLNAISGFDWKAPEGALRILTPHPGEMSRLAQKSVADVQADRLSTALTYAAAHNCILVLKGHRTVIALPDGRAWINPTGSPALAKGGTGDILTGLIAGMAAQFPSDANNAVIAAVYLHGLAGELAEAALTDKCVLATDLLSYVPEATRACTAVSQ
jgi:NAD(P)H-hydrate epimerase